MIKQKITFHEDNITVKSFKEYCNGKIILHEKYNEEGKCIYRVNTSLDLPEVYRYIFKDGKLRKSKKFVDGTLVSANHYDNNERVIKMYGSTIATTLVRYNKDGHLIYLHNHGIKVDGSEKIGWMKIYYRKGKPFKKVFHNGHYKVKEKPNHFGWTEYTAEGISARRSSPIVDPETGQIDLNYTSDANTYYDMSINIIEMTATNIELKNLSKKKW